MDRETNYFHSAWMVIMDPMGPLANRALSPKG